ncbi:MAG: SDR family oxidoreductase [Moraxellaceae bacterium]|nr:MAG: SDR family oxidoreductase [Moraxellaceae bacterium]
MHVLIVGLGDIGRKLATNLVAHGHQVTGMSRTAQTLADVRHLAQSVHHLNLEQVPPIDWVYVLLTPDARSAESYAHIFMDSLKPLHSALQKHPVQRVVFISSTSVYGSGQGEWMDETTPPTPDRATAQVLWQAEQQWRQYWQDQLIVVRPSGIYGSNRLRLIRWVQQGKPVKTNQWTNRIHAHDLAGFLAHLTTLTAPMPLYLATDQQPSLQQEVLDYIAQQLNLPKVAAVAGVLAGKRLSNQRLIQSGYRLQYPSYQQGYDMP